MIGVTGEMISFRFTTVQQRSVKTTKVQSCLRGTFWADTEDEEAH